MGKLPSFNSHLVMETMQHTHAHTHTTDLKSWRTISQITPAEGSRTGENNVFFANYFRPRICTIYISNSQQVYLFPQAEGSFSPNSGFNTLRDLCRSAEKSKNFEKTPTQGRYNPLPNSYLLKWLPDGSPEAFTFSPPFCWCKGRGFGGVV